MTPDLIQSAKMRWLAALMVYRSTGTRSAYEVMQETERAYVAAYRLYGPPAAGQVVARRSQRFAAIHRAYPVPKVYAAA